MIVTYRLKKPTLLDISSKEVVDVSKKLIFKIVGCVYSTGRGEFVFLRLIDDSFFNGKNQWIAHRNNLVLNGFLKPKEELDITDEMFKEIIREKMLNI